MSLQGFRLAAGSRRRRKRRSASGGEEGGLEGAPRLVNVLLKGRVALVNARRNVQSRDSNSAPSPARSNLHAETLSVFLAEPKSPEPSIIDAPAHNARNPRARRPRLFLSRSAASPRALASRLPHFDLPDDRPTTRMNKISTRSTSSYPRFYHFLTRAPFLLISS